MFIVLTFVSDTFLFFCFAIDWNDGMVSLAELRRQVVDDPIVPGRRKDVIAGDEREEDNDGVVDGDGEAEADVEEGEGNTSRVKLQPRIEQLNRHTGEVVRRYSDRFEAASSMLMASSAGIVACCNGRTQTCHSFKWRECGVPMTPGKSFQNLFICL